MRKHAEGRNLRAVSTPVPLAPRSHKNFARPTRRMHHPAMEKVSYQGQTLTRWRVGNSTFLALPERGARLMNWNLTLGDGSVRDVIYWPENADFGDFAKV